MTKVTSNVREAGEFSRREFMHVAGTSAAAVAAGLGTITAQAATPSVDNEICRMDAVTLAEKIRTKPRLRIANSFIPNRPPIVFDEIK